MLKKEFPLPVKFIIGFIYSNNDIYEKTKILLKRRFGAIDFESEQFVFDYTNYYSDEMGENLFRRFIAFKKLVTPDKFAAIKSFCMKLEKKFSFGTNKVSFPRKRESIVWKRRINIDPGYINEAKLVLTTTKDFSHRIYLGQGVYAEITLCYQGGDFRDLPTTYPDYRTKEYKENFRLIREIYRTQIGRSCT
jgi:hypothetical protein